MAISVKLQAFEGPLDLLLHLIEKNKVDIYDIPISLITEQYLEYIDALKDEDMDIASEFLVMAATLLDIKCRMLLPKEENEDGQEEDPRQELVEKLIEYKLYKYMSYELKDRQIDANRNLYKEPSIPDEIKNYVPPIDYDELAKDIIRRAKEGEPINFFHFMIDLTGGPCVAKRLSGCGSGTEYLAVTPWGDLYPCHQFVGNEDFLMGNVDEGILRTDIRDEFKCTNVYAKEKCKKCFAKFYCSGGCAANAYNFHGDINDAYDLGCELQRKRVECAIMIKAALDEQSEGEEQ